MRKIRYIVIHCTATSHKTKVHSIENYWRTVLGWKNPGYHILIEDDGTMHYLTSFNNVTNGVKGFNRESIHIAYIGGQHQDDRTEMQKQGIILAIKQALEYASPNIPIIQGHRDFPNVAKACPQFDAKIEYAYLR